MFSIYENNKKISGACRSLVLCLDYVVTSHFIYFKFRYEWSRFGVFLCFLQSRFCEQSLWLIVISLLKVMAFDDLQFATLLILINISLDSQSKTSDDIQLTKFKELTAI